MIELQLQFSSIGEFFQMGRYTFHVWAVYSVFAVFMGYNLLMPLWQRRQFIRAQRQLQRREARRAGAANGPSPDRNEGSTTA
ncbi:MAG: heme exporter protein CcmD [Pseudomonadota bacterium]